MLRKVQPYLMSRARGLCTARRLCKLAPLYLHLRCITHVSKATRSIEMSSCRHRVHAQAGKTSGGRAIEQRKQQKKRQQKQTGGSESRVSSLALDPAGAVSVDGFEARVPAICAHTALRAAVCWLFSLLKHLSSVHRTHRRPSLPRKGPLWGYLTNGGGGGAGDTLRLQSPRRRRRVDCWYRQRPRLRQPSLLRRRGS